VSGSQWAREPMVPRTEPHAIRLGGARGFAAARIGRQESSCNLRVKNKSSIAGTIVDRLSLRNVQYRTHGNW
jgi:hypothetical protein